MAKTKNNSLRLQQAVKSIFEDYRKKSGCLAPVYRDAACGCDNALQMWRGPKGDKGDQGPQGPKGDNAGSFLVDAEFVVDPEGQEPGSYLKLVLIDVAQQEQVVYVDLSELTDIYTGGNGISIIDMVVAAKLGAGLTFDQQGNITSAYQFCDGLDETSNVVRVRIDTNNNILGFASGTCGGLTATVQLEAGALGEQSGGTTVYVPHLVLYGKNNTVLGRVKLADSDTIDVQMLPNDAGFTWLVNPSGLVSSQTGNQITVSQTDSKLYVGKDTLSYTIGEGVFTLTHPDGTTSAVTVPSAVRMLDRADMVCEGENAPYLRLTFKRDNGQNLYQDIDMSCLATAELSLDVGCDDTVTDTAPDTVCGITIVLYTEAQYNAVIAGTSQSSEGSFIIPDPSADFTTELAAYPGGPDPYAIGLEVYLADPDTGCSNYGVQYETWNELIDVSWFESPSHPIPLADLLSSGTVLRTESTAYPDPLHLSVVDNQDSSYTFSLRLRHEETTLTADLVSGENRVDMTPLLTKIGGKIVEKPGGELTPILIAGQDKAGLAPAGGMNFYLTEQDCCNDDNAVQAINGVVDDTSVTFYFSGLTRPQYVYLGFAFVDANGAPVSNTGYETAMDWSACTDISCSIAAMISGNVVLRGVDFVTGDPVDDFIMTHCEEVIDEQENYGLKFTFFQAAMSPALCLEPSCDPCIDLTPLLDRFSPVATSGSFNDLTDTPTNHVTTDTNQEITGEKTFVGQKKIGFKQSTASDKLGFTLFDRNGDEVGYLEYNPSASGKVNNTPVMTLGNYATKAAERSYVGFRRYSSISGASGAYNLLTPLIVDARTPFNLTTTYTNFYLLLGVSDGTNMYTVGSNGVLDLSAMIPTGLVHINGAETINGVKTFNAGYFGNVEVLTGSTIDVSHATAFIKTLGDDVTFSFTGVPSGRSACFSLMLDYGGDYDVTWPSNTHWCNDTEPELTSGGTDILTFMTFDGGTNWYGTLSMTGITQ